ncbi:MAG: peptidoglycan bridge formation glycyltransferase FemA/FemB family protein [Fibrobacter sp.]|nr:peptidoglycan bridge formation glycyltransferase FemA/FemB family protein [Fibrobacter sp.]
MNLIQINPFVSKLWDNAVLSGSSPQFFQLSSWLKVLADTYGFKPLCYTLESDQSCTIPVLITKSLTGKKKAIALPFSDGCNIDCRKLPHDELVEKLLEIAKCENCKTLEFRGTTTFRPSGEPSHSYFGHVLNLTNEESLLKGLSSSKRRNIKKAQRESTTVTFHNDKDAVHQYYRLHCITRKRHGLPPQSLEFFDSLYDNIIFPKQGEVALAYSNNVPVAGAVYLFCGSEALYKFGASDKSVQNLRSNDLLMWEAIRRYAQKGYKTFSFGKTESFHEGLCRFKEGFGAFRVDLNDYCYNVTTKKIVKCVPGVHGVHNVIFRRMPISFLVFIGKILYKYSA